MQAVHPLQPQRALAARQPCQLPSDRLPPPSPSLLPPRTQYVDKPDLFMYGMLCALLSAGIWLILATYLELPVSTTHSIVGAIIGFSMVAAGAWRGAVQQACSAHDHASTPMPQPCLPPLRPVLGGVVQEPDGLPLHTGRDAHRHLLVHLAHPLRHRSDHPIPLHPPRQ